MSETKPDGVTVKEGGWYKRRDGEIVGPAEPNLVGRHVRWYPWRVDMEVYKSDGRYDAGKPNHRLDLVEEVPNPNTQPDAGDAKDSGARLIAIQAAQIEALTKALNMANVYAFEDADNLVLMVSGVEVVDTTDEKKKSALLLFDATKSAALSNTGK